MLRAAEGGADGLETGDDLIEPELEAKRRCAERVVDVVQARQGQRDGRRSGGRPELKAGVAGAVELDALGSDPRLRPLLATRGTAVAPQVAKVDRLVDVGGAAPAAVLWV